MTVYVTEHTTYEVDGACIRRVVSDHEPTPYQAPHAADWTPVAAVEEFAGRLLITWHDGTSTLTSRVVSVDGVPR